MRLLPDNPELGWTPYFWLVYVSGFLLVPWLKGSGALEWSLTLAALAVFLVLYFLGYWLRGPRLYLVIVPITAIAAAFTPFNAGAPTFFIFAASFAGRVESKRWSRGTIAAIALLCTAEGLLLRLPWYSWTWAVLFSVLIGLANAHAATVSRANARLRLAHDEIERLAKVAERERIARDLHDLLGHTLSVIVLKSELASKLADTDPARARDEIRDVERISRDALAEVRRAVRGYRSAGLVAEIDAATRALESAGIAVERDVAAVKLAATAESALALAVREAATNVLRHAHARRCRIALCAAHDECRLEIHDDGRGGTAPDGSGLAGMRERIEQLGGRVSREGAGGTRLVVTVPLAEAAP